MVAALTRELCLVRCLRAVLRRGVDGAPRPAPPVPGDVLVEDFAVLAEPAAIAGVAAPAAATITAARTTGARHRCVAREKRGYDKHNPFSFSCLRG